MAATAIKHMALNFVKLDKFEGVDFRRWQKKMHFLLSSMSVVYVLTTPIPEDGGDDATVEQVMKRNKWDNDDYVCIELWNSLKAKYMAEDASSKKFLVSNFTNYKMTDSRPVLEQYNELLGILGRFTQHKMNMDESIQVSCIIDKLPPSWKDFKHTLKHLKDELTLVELGNICNCGVGGGSLGCRNKKYFVTFIDDAFRFYYVSLLHTKDEALDKLKVYKTEVKLHQRSLIKRFRIDRRGEYMDTLTESRVLEVVRLPDPKAENFGFIKEELKASYGGYAELSWLLAHNRLSLVPRPSLRIPNGTEDIGGSVILKEFTKELYLIEGTRDEVSDQHSYCFNVEDDPNTFDEAIKSQDGFKQKSGIDNFDTYDPVVRISTIRLLIAMESIYNLIIHQMDVKTAFLNGDLDEEVYMNHPQGFITPGNENKFSMKDMGEADVILGIRIKHKSNGIAISQSYYIEKVLKKFNYFDCTPVSTPMDTMPYIAFDVGKLSRYTSNPGTQHWQAIQRVLKYLKKTMDYRLTYIGYPSVLKGYTDASWINNTEDNSSTSGWVFLLGGGAIS
ncbi:zinc finger, CCHC-type containing protein [Tanacetum coccineum]